MVLTRERVADTDLPSPDGRRRVLLLDDADDDGIDNKISKCLQLAGGYEVHCLSGLPDTALRRSKYARVRSVPLDTPAGMLAAVAAYVERRPVDLVLPIDERMIVMAGEVADQLERLAPLAPGPDPDLCRRVDDKWSFHELMSDAGLPVPRTALATSDPDALTREHVRWGSAHMLKPRIGAGGEGIRQFERPDDLLEALDGLPPSTREDFIVQEFIPGEDVSCNILAVDGEIVAHTVSRKALADAREFKSAGLGIEFIRDEAASTMARRFAGSIGWTGVANLNLRIDARTGQPILIEVNPRYWQTVLGSLAMGTNFPDLQCRLAFGQSPVPSESRVGFYLDVPPLLISPRDTVLLLRRDPGLLRYIDRRIVVADPRVDAYIVFRTLKLVIAKVVSLAVQPFRRVLGGRGRVA